jgi:hypothetical protein
MSSMVRQASLLLAGAAALAGLAGVPAHAQQAAAFSVYASGLEAPRGLRFGPDGFLYVAEAGLGGTFSTGTSCTQVPGPVGPYTGGTTARISKIDSHGNRTTVASGFPSTVDAQGDLIGVADVAFLNGELYAVVAGGGCSHGNPQISTGIARVNRYTGKWNLFADVGAWLKTHPAAYESAGDFEPDGTLYSLIAVDGLLVTVEPNHGQVLAVTTGGAIQQVIDVSASEGHIVPTAAAVHNDALYLGNLNLFPENPDWSRILTIAKPAYQPGLAPGFAINPSTYHIISSKAGFTAVVAVDFGPDGLLYALELTTAAGYPTPGTGKVVRVKPSGVIEDVITGLVVPTGMTFGPDGRLYISDFGAVPAGAPPPPGVILQYDIPLG